MGAKEKKNRKPGLSMKFWILAFGLGSLFIAVLIYISTGFPIPFPLSLQGDYEYQKGDTAILKMVVFNKKEIDLDEAVAKIIFDDLGCVFWKHQSGSDISAEIIFIRNGTTLLRLEVLYDGTIMKNGSLYEGPYALRRLVRKHY